MATRSRAKQADAPGKGEATRRHIIATSLALFRARGFERTTMRHIAAAAGLSLGAAYYYFPSKESIVLAYYNETQARHRERTREALAAEVSLGARLRAVMHAKLDVVEGDRKLLGALFRGVGTVSGPLAVLAPGTLAVRAASMAIFDEALAPAGLPEELRAAAGPALWLLHLGLLAYFIQDESPGQERTRRLVDGTVDLVVDLVRLAALPGMEALRGRIARLLADAALVPKAGERE